MASFGNDELYEAMADRFESLKFKPLTPELAAFTWAEICGVLCHQLTDTSRLTSAKKGPTGMRVNLSNFGAFVRVHSRDSCSSIPTVMFIPHGSLSEMYGLTSTHPKWRVSGTIRTHDLNLREVARRLERSSDETTRILQGTLQLIAERGEEKQNVTIVFPRVGELKIERKIVTFRFNIQPHESFTYLCSSVARVRPSTAGSMPRDRPQTAAAPGLHGEEDSDAEPHNANEANLRNVVKAAIGTSDAPELRKLQRPGSSHSTGSAKRPSSAAPVPLSAAALEAHENGSSSLQFLARDGRPPLAGAAGAPPEVSPSMVRSFSAGGKFAAVKARRHVVAQELEALQRQALDRLGSNRHPCGAPPNVSPDRLHSSHARQRPASAAGSTASRLTGNSISALSGSLASNRRPGFRQPSPFAVERAIESAFEREYGRKERTALDEEIRADRQKLRQSAADAALAQHKHQTREYNAKVQTYLNTQKEEKQQRTKAGALSCIYSRDTSPFEKYSSPKWERPSSGLSERRQKQAAYKSSLDEQRSLQRNIQDRSRAAELEEEAVNNTAQTRLAIEEFREKEERKRAKQTELQLAWQEQLDLKYA